VLKRLRSRPGARREGRVGPQEFSRDGGGFLAASELGEARGQNAQESKWAEQGVAQRRDGVPYRPAAYWAKPRLQK
jgi:hypothetical protein